MVTARTHAPRRTVMMLDRLGEVFGSDRQLAEVIGMDPAQITRWRKGQQPSEPAWDRLVDLFAVVSKVEGFYPPTRIRLWLEGPNAPGPPDAWRRWPRT